LAKGKLLDELSTSGPNRVSHLHQGRVTTFDLNPADLGLRPASLDDLRGGDPPRNASMLRSLLAGEDEGPRREIVMLNAAAAMAAEDGEFESALIQAKASLDDGAALESLEKLRALSQRLGKGEAAG